MVSVIADSSCYICFTDDINCPSFFNQMLEKPLHFIITKAVHKEIEKSPNYSQIQMDQITEVEISYNIGDLLRGVFGTNEITKGEHEVVMYAGMNYTTNSKLMIILDDAEARKILEKNFPALKDDVHGTVGLVVLCHCNYNMVKKKDALDVINAIDKSGFFVSNDVVNQARSQLEEC